MGISPFTTSQTFGGEKEINVEGKREREREREQEKREESARIGMNEE